MPLINCKIELLLNWIENCVLSSAGTAATFTITDAKLYVPIITLKTEDNTKLSKLLSDLSDFLTFTLLYSTIFIVFAKLLLFLLEILILFLLIVQEYNKP